MGKKVTKAGAVLLSASILAFPSTSYAQKKLLTGLAIGGAIVGGAHLLNRQAEARQAEANQNQGNQPPPPGSPEQQRNPSVQNRVMDAVRERMENNQGNANSPLITQSAQASQPSQQATGANPARQQNSRDANQPQAANSNNRNQAPAQQNIPVAGPSSGRWQGPPGNSGWISAVPAVNNVTRGAPVPFSQGKPDFSRWAVMRFEVAGLNGTEADQAKIHAELAKRRGLNSPAEAQAWLRENRYVAHRARDRRTVEILPADLHNNIAHQD